MPLKSLSSLPLPVYTFKQAAGYHPFLLQLAMFDPVRVVGLHKHVTGKLEECLGVHGLPGYSALMQGVDVVVREQLVEFLPQHLARRLLAFEDV